MHALAIRNRGPFRLGAEELIELGQTQAAMVSSAPRSVTLSREEAELLVKVLENIKIFGEKFPLEFYGYCPLDLWGETTENLQQVLSNVDMQLQRGHTTVTVPANVVLKLVDLEKCVSAARDARLTSAKIAFGLSAGGVIANMVFGVKWIALPAYLAGLAVLFGQPIMALLTAKPEEPFKPSLAGNNRIFLERVVVSRSPKVQNHYWGTVQPSSSIRPAAVCLSKGRFRVRVEGWEGDVVTPTSDWKRIPEEACRGDMEIVVWEACGEPPRATPYGPAPEKAHTGDAYWVEYTGPLTQGACRTAGPFCCPVDSAMHGQEDGGFAKAGDDGGYIVYDSDWNVYESGV